MIMIVALIPDPLGRSSERHSTVVMCNMVVELALQPGSA
jgi:hypothetical protein